MKVVWGAIAGFIMTIISMTVGALVSEELRSRLDRMPHAVLRLAIRRLPVETRQSVGNEWQAELHHILRHAESRPITRLLKATPYTFGLLRKARRVGRELKSVRTGARAQNHKRVAPRRAVRNKPRVAFGALGLIIGMSWPLGMLMSTTSVGRASIMSWLLAGVIIVLLALVTLELVAAYPLSGGTMRWSRIASGSMGGFTVGWVSWLHAVLIAPIEVEAALIYLNHQWHGLINSTGALTTTGLGVGIALMLLVTVINLSGIRWLTIAVPLLTIFLIVFSFHTSSFINGGSFAPYSAHGMFAALPLGVVFALLVFEQAAQTSGEARNLTYMGVAARFSYELGRAGYVPGGVSRINSRGVPYPSIILAFVVGLICFLPFLSWQSLVSLMISATVTMYAFAPIALLVLRKADPHGARPYRLPAASVLSPLAFIAANEIIYWTSSTTVWKLMLAILAGYALLGISYMAGRPIERPPLDPKSLLWIVPWFVGLAVLSNSGQYGDTKLIPEWADLGAVAAFSLVIFYLAVALSSPNHRVSTAIAADKFEAALQPELKTA